jgi:hypothetical protein
MELPKQAIKLDIDSYTRPIDGSEPINRDLFIIAVMIYFWISFGELVLGIIVGGQAEGLIQFLLFISNLMILVFIIWRCYRYSQNHHAKNVRAKQVYEFEKSAISAFQPTVTISNHPVCLGETVTLNFTFSTISFVAATQCSVNLVQVEEVRYEVPEGSFGTRTAYNTVDHVFMEQSLPINELNYAIMQPIDKNNPEPLYTYSWPITIPVTAMHTFRGSGGSIYWEVRFLVELPPPASTKKVKTCYKMIVLAKVM